MAQEYTQKQVIQAGKDLVDLLLNLAKSNNNLTGFIKEYLIHLTSNNGIYQQQQEELLAFAASSDNVHRSIADNSKISAEKLSEICAEFANMNSAIEMVHAGGVETNNEAVKLAENITEIRKFIKDIQDISSRTNLLSFNASIEAARAGEAGKGFRIIANEVKSLSAKTQEVSKRIDDTILEMHNNLEKFIEKNTEHSRILGDLQTMALRVRSRWNCTMLFPICFWIHYAVCALLRLTFPKCRARHCATARSRSPAKAIL